MLDLEAIKGRHDTMRELANYGGRGDEAEAWLLGLEGRILGEDVPALIAEVGRLRDENALLNAVVAELGARAE